MVFAWALNKCLCCGGNPCTRYVSGVSVVMDKPLARQRVNRINGVMRHSYNIPRSVAVAAMICPCIVAIAVITT